MSRPKKPEPILSDCDWTPLDAITWLKRRAKKQKFGTNYFQLCLEVVRNLLHDRQALYEQTEELLVEIARLQNLKTPTPFDVGMKPWGD